MRIWGTFGRRAVAALLPVLLAVGCFQGANFPQGDDARADRPDVQRDIPDDRPDDVRSDAVADTTEGVTDGFIGDLDLPDAAPEAVDPGADPALDPASDPVSDPALDPASDAASDPGQADVPDVPLQAWGWISVIEPNDTCDQWYLKTQWFGGVRAYFATAPSFNRALPHTLGFARAVDSEGSCTLYDPGIMTEDCLGMCLCLDKGVECYSEDMTSRWCGQDEVCVKGPGEPDPGAVDFGVCEPLPAHFDVGTITIAGLKTPVTMTADEYDRYLAQDLKEPNDLFDAGDAITATTTGGGLPPLTFTAKGVAPLTRAPQDEQVEVRTGRDSVVRWTPADPGSRIQVVLAVGSHDPNPLGGAILCDVPDGDGQVTVAGRLLDRLHFLSCDGGWTMKCSRITRYTRHLVAGEGRELELFVGSARNLMMVRP